jgi:hypothetical protein
MRSGRQGKKSLGKSSRKISLKDTIYTFSQKIFPKGSFRIKKSLNELESCVLDLCAKYSHYLRRYT